MQYVKCGFIKEVYSVTNVNVSVYNIGIVHLRSPMSFAILLQI